MTPEALRLLAGLLVAHYLGDFTPLAGDRIQEAKSRGGPIGSLAVHAGIHAVLVGAAVVLLTSAPSPIVTVAVALEFGTHLAVDAVRAQAGVRFASLNDPRRGSFWRVLGLDQLAHGLVLLAIAALVLGGA